MGGKALKLIGVEARRIPSEEYHRLLGAIESAAGGLFDKLQGVPFYRTKESHGDIDVAGVVSDQEWVKKFALSLGSQGIVRRDDDYSFEFKGAQVDVAAFDNQVDLSNYLNFCSWSPVGSVVKRLVSAQGAVWGMSGMKYSVWDEAGGGNIIGSVHLTDDMSTVLGVAGLDSEQWKVGFERMEDVFEWGVKSPSFNKGLYALENLSSPARRANQKRPDYMAFIDYMADKPDNCDVFDTRAATGEKLEELDSLFPHVKLIEQVAGIRDRAATRKLVAQKLNGAVIMEMTDLRGAALGKAIDGFRTSMGGEDKYYEWLAEVSNEEARKAFLGFTRVEGELPGRGVAVSRVPAAREQSI